MSHEAKIFLQTGSKGYVHFVCLFVTLVYFSLVVGGAFRVHWIDGGVKLNRSLHHELQSSGHWKE